MQFDISVFWNWISIGLAAIVLIGNAVEKIGKAVAAARKPNEQQDAAIRGLEVRMEAVERKLVNDKTRLDAYEAGMRVSQQALLALLDHSLDGNNIKQMEEAKNAIQKHLLNK